MSGSCLAEAVRSFRAAVDGLLEAPLTPVPSVELAQTLVELETQRRRLEAVEHRLLPEVADRGLAGDYARASTTDLLVELLRVSPGEARARVARAGDLGPRRAVSGEKLGPLLPAAAAAVRAGEISAAGHAAVITKVLDRIPADLAADATPVAEAMLVQAARHQHPRALAQTGELLLARLDPDGRAPRDEDVERRRDLTLNRWADGSGTLRGSLTADAAAALATVLDALSAPRPAVDQDPDHDARDPRTAGQRRHDALHEALLRLLRAGTLPAAGGVPVTILATTTMRELHTELGTATTGHGDVLTIAQLLQMATDAQIIPVVCNDTGGILAYGRAYRLATCAQRLALAARDGGCVFPGCDRPAAWTEVHHVIPWQHGGHTDLDNMCLLCPYHHRTFEAAGWQIVMLDGVPHCVPPPWLDPDRKPRRNTAHHPADIDFAGAA